MAAQPHAVMSIEEYLAFDRQHPDQRYEYSEGTVRMMSGGTINHATIAGNIWSALRQQLRGGPCRPHTADVRVRLTAARYVYPDVTVSCDPEAPGTSDMIDNPRLVVEVLSPSNEAHDRGRKADWYRACPTIEEMMLVDSQRYSVQLQQRVGNLWRIITYEGLTGDVELASLQVRVPLAEIYENVSLLPADEERELPVE